MYQLGEYEDENDLFIALEKVSLFEALQVMVCRAGLTERAPNRKKLFPVVESAEMLRWIMILDYYLYSALVFFQGHGIISFL